jgi:tetratricopeptide (TPR) repeat protein
MKTGEVAPIEDFVYPANSGDNDNSVWFMPAGRKDKQYQSDLSLLDWKMLYKQKMGFLFIENLKASIQKKFDPDYVLIDSRTGLTDVSGICTIQLPNLVVLLFSLNNQNLLGTSQIYRSIRDSKVNRAIGTLLVASPVPELPDSINIRKDRLEYATKVLGSAPNLILPYDPFVAFIETIVQQENISAPLAKAYDALAHRIVNLNSEDVSTMLKLAREHIEAGNAELAELKFQEIIESKPKSHDAWLEFGLFERLRGKTSESREYFKKALEIQPQDEKALASFATTSLDLQQRTEATQTLKKLLAVSKNARLLTGTLEHFVRGGELEVALEGYRQLIRMNLTRASISASYIALGEIYMRMKKYREASEVYMVALGAFPSDLVLAYNAGYALKQLGDERYVNYFRTAADLFEHYDQSRVSPVWLTNAYKAMGHAYMGIGQLEKAEESVKEGISLANKVTISPLYSSISYTYVPRDTFIREARELLSEIENASFSIGPVTKKEGSGQIH